MKEIAENYLKKGLSVIPVKMPDKKPAVKSWKEFQSRIAEPDQLVMIDYLKEEAGIAVVCGRISGNLEILDFDNKLGNIDQTFKAYISIPAVKEIFTKRKIPYEKTLSGGYHVFYRSKIQVDGNKKLAERIKRDGTKEEKVCIIETRGEGGYVIVSPTPGYSMLTGSLESIPVLDPDERETLLSYAKSFGEIVVEEWDEVKLPGRGLEHISKDEIKALLEENGWKYIGTHLENDNYCRPGKRTGVSATFNGEVFYVFSSNAGLFEPGKGYNKFQLFTLLKYGGRVEEAKAEIFKRAGIVQEEQNKHFIQYVANGSGTFIPSVIEENYSPFLKEKGIYRYDIGDDYKIIRVKDHVIREIQPHDIVDICKKGLDPALRAVLLKYDKRFLGGSAFNHLEKFEGKIMNDTFRSSFLFFEDGWIEVKADGTEWYSYNEMDGYIWKDQIIKHKFNIGVSTPSVFEQFVKNVTNCQADAKRFKALCSGIGYMLHRYKNPAVTKAFILCDEGIDGELDPDSSNGGTGKSLICRAISMVRNTCFESGRNFRFDNNFKWQKVNPDTEVIWFDDTSKGFKFNMLFDAITNGMDVEKKNRSAYTIPFEDSPKFIIATNYTIAEYDESTRRRIFEVELAPYYSADKTPVSEFGKHFFAEWTEEEWRDFYNFMISCLEYYLRFGLTNYKHVNLEKRKLLQAVGQEFIDFFQEFVAGLSEDLNGEVVLSKHAFYEKLAERREFKNVTPNSSTIKIKRLLKEFKADYRETKYTGDRRFIFKPGAFKVNNENNEMPI